MGAVQLPVCTPLIPSCFRYFTLRDCHKDTSLSHLFRQFTRDRLSVPTAAPAPQSGDLPPACTAGPSLRSAPQRGQRPLQSSLQRCLVSIARMNSSVITSSRSSSIPGEQDDLILLFFPAPWPADAGRAQSSPVQRACRSCHSSDAGCWTGLPPTPAFPRGCGQRRVTVTGSQMGRAP